MRIVYTSDLHGNQQHYARVLHFAIEQGARAVMLGGDLFPNSHEPGRGLLLQRQFVRDVFAPWLHRIRAEFRSLSVYALPGNEDWASTTDLLVDLAESELFYPLHHRVWRLNGRTWLAGSSLVQSNPAGTIYVFHSPPYATALDRLPMAERSAAAPCAPSSRSTSRR